MSDATFPVDRPSGRLSPNSAISIGLAVVLISAAVVYGRQSQQLETVSSDVKELRTEVGEIRLLLLRQQTNKGTP